MFVVLAAILMLGSLGALLFATHLIGLQVAGAEGARERNERAAEAAVEVAIDRMRGKAELGLGTLSEQDLGEIEDFLTEVPMPSGHTLLAEESEVVELGERTQEVIPHGIEPLTVTTDWPRFAHTVRGRWEGMWAESITEYEVRVSVTGPRRSQSTATGRLGVARVHPHQSALAMDGAMDLCVPSDDHVAVSGRVWAGEGAEVLCSGRLEMAGGLEIQDDLVTEAHGTNRLYWGNNWSGLSNVSREQSEDDLEGVFEDWGGRIKVISAMGTRMLPTFAQAEGVMGSGECLDFDEGCGGEVGYFPSVTIQRTEEVGGSFSVECAESVSSETCDAVGQALSYHPYPFDSSDADEARADPDDPSQLWHGLYFDPRRESRCDADVGGHEWRTFRCPTNPYGFVLDMSEMPDIPGGLLSVRRAATAAQVNDPEELQEVLVIRNAVGIPGPLSLHSEIPVTLEGDYNRLTDHPALIDAPLISVLPNETADQLETATVWDSVPDRPHRSLEAQSTVTISAVLRSFYHPSPEPGEWGGSLQLIPSVIGDWSETRLKIRGAVEGRAQEVGTEGTYSAAYPPFGSEPTEMAPEQPNARRLVWDPNLREGTRQPPGSWGTVPVEGAGGTRSHERQSNATGGWSVIYRLGDPETARAGPW